MLKSGIRSHVALAALMAVPMNVSVISAGWSQINEIVVTTRKREENLQDLPIAVTVIGEDAIERQGVTGLEDIATFSPSFIFNESSSQRDVRVVVRGLSPTRGRSNVAFLVDGIDVTSEAIGSPGASLLVSQRLLADVQRVEAVKGPKSALYGRAAFAGAINYVTKDAPTEFEGQVGTEIAEYGEYSVNGSVGGPVAENLGVLVSGFYWDEEGQYSNAVSGGDIGGGDGWGGSLTVNFDPTETVSIKGRLEYTDEEYNPRPRARIEPNALLTAGELPAGTPANIVSEAVADGGSLLLTNFGDADGVVIRSSESVLTGDDHEGNTLELFRASLIGSWDVDSLGGTLTSYTGYIDSSSNEDFSLDGAAEGRPDVSIGEFWSFGEFETEIFSQEIRYQSNWDGPVQITFGGNYWTSERTYVEKGMLGNGCDFLSTLFNGECATAPRISVPWQEAFERQLSAGNINIRQPLYVDDDHWSVYGMLEWEITDQWKLTLENRYVEEEQTIDRAVLIANGSSTPGTFDVEETCSLFTANAADDLCKTVATAETIGFDVVSGFNGFETITVIGTGRRSDTVTSSYNTPKATLEFSPNDDLLFFISAGKGQKPGGIDVLGGGANAIFDLDSKVFDPEEMWAYEIGAKTNWSGDFGALQLNGSAFFQDYSDKQVSLRFRATDGTITRRTENAASAEVWGVEVDAFWKTPVEGLSFSAAYTWLDTEFIEFTDISDDPFAILRAGNCVPEVGDDLTLGTGDDECTISFAGNELEGAPEHAFVAAATLTRPFANTSMNWFVEADTQYQSKRFAAPDNSQVFDDYWKLNLRAGLTGDNWEALVFIDNVTGDNTIQSAAGIPDTSMILNPAIDFRTADVGLLPRKRQIGIRAKYRF